MKMVFALITILCLTVTSAYAHDVRVGVNVGVRVNPNVVYDPPLYGPRRRLPHCARRDLHCWWNDDYQRVCHRHRRDSCYWYYR